MHVNSAIKGGLNLVEGKVASSDYDLRISLRPAGSVPEPPMRLPRWQSPGGLDHLEKFCMHYCKVTSNVKLLL